MGACATKGSGTVPETHLLTKKESSGSDVWEDTGVEKPKEQRRRRLSVSTVNNPTGMRTKLVTYQDAKMALVEPTRGTVREVTLKMITDLFPRAHNYAVFGSPSYSIQRGFDNKIAETNGDAPAKNLQDIGVGYTCKKGLKPESPNQDDYFILHVDDWSIYGVFDGHGPYGHDVSAFVHKALPFLLISDPLFETDIKTALRNAFLNVNHLLDMISHQNKVDCTLSGSTGTVVVKRDGQLTVAHVGDSRAVLARKIPGGFQTMDLTNDHKPTIPEEKKRIERSGGEVKRLEGDIPHRVFMRNKMYPGLAMSRALGDILGHSVGVSCEPDIFQIDIESDFDFIVVATDGVWEFIESDMAVDLVSNLLYVQDKSMSDTAEYLAYEAWRQWVKEEDNVVDDITCIVVRL